MNKTKTCPHGHNYSADLPSCPFCPTKDSMSNLKTQIVGEDMEKTVVDSSQPRYSQTNKAPKNSDRTMIMDSSPSSPQAAQANSLRKLVGWLVSFDLAPEGRDFRIVVGRTRIGRNPNSDFIINSSGVSDDHAILLYRDNKLWIQDQLSTNGTFVNDELIEDKIRLKNHDIIRIGTTDLKLVLINPEE
ncbi:MAG TPA: FHA domain-containing protein [Candidatus Cloacimonadota bacterium]|nr:FHA domain-containing protein [Candidatus Cloacimonadota bacterium]HQB41731.1 FHA domain-containing protein [Candidatus Cloacimonadota bacterium]